MKTDRVALASEDHALQVENARLRSEVEQLRQVASGNVERLELLVAKHSGKPYDTTRLDILQAQMALCFPAGPSIEAYSALQADADRLRVALAEIASGLDEVNTLSDIARRALGWDKLGDVE
jgi:hypothetical protein